MSLTMVDAKKKAPEAADNSRQRLDKFLVYARFVKSRTLALALIKGGRVRLNGARMTKADRMIGAGDILTLALPHATEVIRLLDLPDKRGSAHASADLYERLSDEKSAAPPKSIACSEPSACNAQSN